MIQASDNNDTNSGWGRAKRVADVSVAYVSGRGVTWRSLDTLGLDFLLTSYLVIHEPP